MEQFSWLGPSLFAFVGLAWWSHPLEKAFFFDLTTKERWIRRLARVGLLLLAVLFLSSLGDFSKVRGSEFEIDIPYSF